MWVEIAAEEAFHEEYRLRPKALLPGQRYSFFVCTEGCELLKIPCHNRQRHFYRDLRVVTSKERSHDPTTQRPNHPMTHAGYQSHTERAFETRLIRRFQEGDPDAVTVLFDLHAERVFAYARHLTGSREDAEEIVLEAFQKAFEKAAGFRGDSPFRGWLFGIARNLCLDRLRQPRLPALEMDALFLSDEGRMAAQIETQATVRQAVALLPEDQRLVLMLCDVEQWDAKEAAEMLDKSLMATKSLLYRARRSLRTHLTALWDDESEENIHHAV